MNFASLKTKMAVAISLLFLVFGAVLGWLVFSSTRQHFKEGLSSQQFTLVTSLARELDNKFALSQNALLAAIPRVPAAAATDAEVAQRFLDSKTSLHLLFDNGLFIFSPAGRLVAESPYQVGRRGRDISFRDYYKTTIATGKPQISEPYVSTHNPGHPAILLTVPLFDKEGKLSCILAGSIDLYCDRFLESITRTRIGTSGHLVLVSRDRTIIYHPQRSRIMTRVPSGINRLLDRAMNGFEGSGETITTQGVPMLASYKRLASTGWILGADFPLAEAYAPLRKIQWYYVGTTVLGIVAMMVASWLIMRQLLAPLFRFIRHVEGVTASPGTYQPLPVAAPDEIGLLAVAFNRMMAAIGEQQAALRESEAKFAKAFRAAPTMMMISTIDDGMVIDINEAFERSTGYRRAEVVGRQALELGAWESPEERTALIAELREKGRVTNREICRRNVAGTPFVGLVSVEIIEIGGREHLFTLINDITERKQMELELWEAMHRAEDERAKTEAIIAAIADGISIVDLSYQIVYQNQVHRELKGADHLGKYCYQAYHGKNGVCADCPVACCFADGQVHKVEKAFTVGGRTTFVEITASPLRDGSGAIIAAIEMVRDITARRVTEDRIRRLNEELEHRVGERTAELQRALREMETFCYSVSHDLRTPLRGISGFAVILQEEYGATLDQPGREYLGRMAAAAVRMGELIDDLLALARISRGELRHELVDLGELALEVVESFEVLRPDGGAQFIIAEGLAADGDPGLLRVVLDNLLSNALKFSSRQPGARIEFGAAGEAPQQVFFVRDNGVGFDMQYAHKLFVPFQRLHAADEFEGTGIGLATVQRVIERHGGRIWAESQPGEGATFFFTLGWSGPATSVSPPPAENGR
ncbi:hypothetical protein GURASL_07480 [Geotalea uraniireducens]|uniref:histidine kinase n=1 Tax=Geotalea uraniireducens TaxID=351604 RepID=A0ABN6VRX1_9BACT|nr:PAS domain S-box protein [Geotalea uraniireducens]BDV41825.1 hypothetical protein GURASL_07480 [Geotalea uraniireducens]